MIKPTQKHIDTAKKILHYPSELELLHKALELAENEAEQSEYITAEQARELGAGKAEQLYTLDTVHCWKVCGEGFQYPTWRQGQVIKYRAIKQPKPAEPHAELKALYAQQVADGTLDDFTWEIEHHLGGMWLDVGTPSWASDMNYRCIPKAKKVIRLDPEIREGVIALLKELNVLGGN